MILKYKIEKYFNNKLPQSYVRPSLTYNMIRNDYADIK